VEKRNKYMNIVTKYLMWKYTKYFFIVLFSLETFFLGMDLLQNFKDLPDSANLQLLYIMYNGFFILSIVIPLSLVFAFIILIINLIKNNEFVAFYSLGLNKKQIILPILTIAIISTFSLIAVQTTPLAYSEQQKKKILDDEYFVNTKENLFLKYDNYFVYFKKLHPLEKRAEDISIYLIKDDDIIETILAKNAYFKNNQWYATDVKIISKPSKLNWSKSKLKISYKDSIYTLKGFKPKILDNVYATRSSYSISDAIQAYILLTKQGLDTTSIRNSIYYNMLIPFFILPLILIIFLYSSISNRFFQVNLFSSLAIALTLSLWGILFFLNKLSAGSVIIPEISLLIPLLILYIYTYKLYIKKRNII
jgi:lipopolysaccharide export system permease protein